MNNADAYNLLLAEGVRAEMLRAAMEAAAAANSNNVDDDDDEKVEGDGDVELPDAELSTASDNATFLASKLKFTRDSSGQEIAVDDEGNGVMMGWERDIMRATADRLCEPFEARRNGARDEDEELNVVNVGFGLGIVSRLSWRSGRYRR
jgi:protein arginine N-methyltransferase 2